MDNLLGPATTSTQHFVNESIREAVEELENLKLIPDSKIRDHGELRSYSAQKPAERIMEFVWKGKIAITFTPEINIQLGIFKLHAQHHYDAQRTATSGN